MVGDWRSAHEHAWRPCNRRGGRHQPHVEYATIILASVAGNQGRLEEAARGRPGARTGAPIRSQSVAHARRTRMHGSGRAAAAATTRRSLRSKRPDGRAVEQGLEEPGVAAWRQELAEAYVRADRPTDAEEVLETLEAQARSHRPAPRPRRCRSLPRTAGDQRRLRGALPPRAGVARRGHVSVRASANRAVLRRAPQAQQAAARRRARRCAQRSRRSRSWRPIRGRIERVGS